MQVPISQAGPKIQAIADSITKELERAVTPALQAHGDSTLRILKKKKASGPGKNDGTPYDTGAMLESQFYQVGSKVTGNPTATPISGVSKEELVFSAGGNTPKSTKNAPDGVVRYAKKVHNGDAKHPPRPWLKREVLASVHREFAKNYGDQLAF